MKAEPISLALLVVALIGSDEMVESEDREGLMSERDLSPADLRAATADGSWMLWTTIGLVVIWVAVVVISLFSPDLVSGSEQEHIAAPAFTAWLWGLIGTIGFIWGMSKLRGDAGRRPIWVGLGVAITAIWLIATILSITLPVFETGSDPTQLPVAAIVAPLGAAVLTTLASVVAGIFSRPPTAT